MTVTVIISDHLKSFFFLLENGFKGNALLMVKPFDELRVTYEERFTQDKVQRFVDNNRFPLVVPFSEKAASRIMEVSHPYTPKKGEKRIG